MTGLSRRDIALVFGVGLLVRVLHLWAVADAPFFDLKMGDSEFFHEWALELSGGDWVGDGVFWYAPMYPYFMGAVYAVFGLDALWLRGLQTLIGAATCVFLALATGRLLGQRAGLVAGFLTALYSPAIFYDGLIHKPVLALFFLAIFLWLWVGLLDAPERRRRWIGLGVTLGALILTRENTMAFAPMIPIWLWIRHDDRPATSRAVWAVCFVAGVTAVVLPVALRNKVVGGELHLTAANFGDNFYKGNHPGADGTYKPLKPGRANPRFEREDATAMAEAAEGRALTPSEVSNWLTEQSLRYMREQPGDWTRLTLRKIALFFNAVELPDTEDLYTYADHSPVLAASDRVLHFGLLVPLAFAGLVITWRHRRRLWLLYILSAAYAGSIVVFYVFGRYRYPIVAFFVIAAAGALAEGPAWLRQATVRARVFLLVVFAATATLANWPMYATDPLKAITAVNIGTSLQEQGDTKGAIAQLEHAVALSPGFADAWYNLGATLEADGRPGDAFAVYGQTLAKNPDHPLAHGNLGVLLMKAGEPERALTHFERAATLTPNHAKARADFAAALLATGQKDRARPHVDAALRLAPDSPQARQLKAVLNRPK